MSREVTTQESGQAPDPRGPRSREDPTAGAHTPPDPRPGRRRWVVLAALVAVVLVTAWGPWRAHGDVRDGTTVVDRAGLAARHGIDVNLVAVTAAGGLVELRMQITDPDKANAVIHGAQGRPVLVAEDTGQTLAMAAPPHHKTPLELGREYFFLLANAHNALRAGSEVTIVVDDVRLEHVEVQG
jgi:hypothetical protein